MLKNLKKITLDYGKTVLCDSCSKDYTDSNEHGGVLFMGFGTMAICPACAPDFIDSVKGLNEEKYIKGYCPPYLSFRDWVLTMR